MELANLLYLCMREAREFQEIILKYAYPRIIRSLSIKFFLIKKLTKRELQQIRRESEKNEKKI